MACDNETNTLELHIKGEKDVIARKQ